MCNLPSVNPAEEVAAARASLREAVFAMRRLESQAATLKGQVVWNGTPEIDDDEGGTAGVREPRRPGPAGFPPAAAAAELVYVAV